MSQVRVGASSILPLATFFFSSNPAGSAAELTRFFTLQYGGEVRERSDPPAAYVCQPPPPPPPPAGRWVARLSVPLVV